MNNAKLKEANSQVAEAEKYLKTSFFKWRPDYDSAASCYQKAAVSYKIGKDLEKACQTYVKLADCHYRNNSRFHAGKAYEEAAQVCKEMKDFEKAMAHFDHASELYMEDGTPDTAALCLDRAGKIVQMTHPEWAIASFMKAAEIYENEDQTRFRSAAELIGKVARLQVSLQKYSEAAKSVTHEKKLLSNVEGGDHGASARLTCALVLLHLKIGDQVQAELSLHDACETVDGFEESEEYQALQKLLEAFDKHDQEKLTLILNTPLFKYMDTAYAKLARSLYIPGMGSDTKKIVHSAIPTQNAQQLKEKVSAVTEQFDQLKAAANAVVQPRNVNDVSDFSDTTSKIDSVQNPETVEDDLC